jgi:hypothetical protein
VATGKTVEAVQFNEVFKISKRCTSYQIKQMTQSNKRMGMATEDSEEKLKADKPCLKAFSFIVDSPTGHASPQLSVFRLTLQPSPGLSPLSPKAVPKYQDPDARSITFTATFQEQLTLDYRLEQGISREDGAHASHTSLG